jgi:hypothetical protein
MEDRQTLECTLPIVRISSHVGLATSGHQAGSASGCVSSGDELKAEDGVDSGMRERWWFTMAVAYCRGVAFPCPFAFALPFLFPFEDDCCDNAAAGYDCDLLSKPGAAIALG